MKLKTKEESASEGAPTQATVAGGPAIAARFQLDGDPRAVRTGPAGVGRTATIVALVAALVALGIVSFSTWLMYSDWAVATVS